MFLRRLPRIFPLKRPRRVLHTDPNGLTAADSVMNFTCSMSCVWNLILLLALLAGLALALNNLSSQWNRALDCGGKSFPGTLLLPLSPARFTSAVLATVTQIQARLRGWIEQSYTPPGASGSGGKQPGPRYAGRCIVEVRFDDCCKVLQH